MLTLKTIRAAARARRIKWRYHALLRAYQRGITRDQALQVLTVHWLDPRKWEDPWTRKPKPPKLRRRERP